MATRPFRRHECLAQIAAPCRTPRRSIGLSRLFPKVEPRQTSLWLTKYWQGTSARRQTSANTADRFGVGHILAVGVDLYCRASAENGMIRGILLLDIVRMDAVGIVGRHHERGVDSAQICFLIASEAEVDALQQVGQQRRCGALLRSEPVSSLSKMAQTARGSRVGVGFGGSGAVRAA